MTTPGCECVCPHGWHMCEWASEPGDVPASPYLRVWEHMMSECMDEKDACRFRGQIKSWQRGPFLQDLQGWPNARVNLCCGYQQYSSSCANCYSYRPWQLILPSAVSSGSKLTIVDSSVGPGRRSKKRGSLETLYFSWFLLGVWVQSRHLEELPDLVLEVSGAVPCLGAWTSCPPSLNIKTEALKFPTIKRSPTFWAIWPSWDRPQQQGEHERCGTPGPGEFCDVMDREIKGQWQGGGQWEPQPPSEVIKTDYIHSFRPEVAKLFLTGETGNVGFVVLRSLLQLLTSATAKGK